MAQGCARRVVSESQTERDQVAVVRPQTMRSAPHRDAARSYVADSTKPCAWLYLSPPSVALGRIASVAWSLALTPPNREFATARALTRYEFPHHVFKIRRRVARRGREHSRLYPAFPGYIFVAASDAWDFLRERCAISRYISRQLPSGIVPALVASADAEGVLPTAELLHPRFRAGQPVRIRGASLLAGHAALFQNLISDTDAIVLIDWMGRWVPITVDERDLVSEVISRRSSRKRQRRRRRDRRRSGPPARN